MESGEANASRAELANKVGQYLNSLSLPLGDTMDVLLFLLGDAMSQASDEVMSPALYGSVCRDLAVTYRAHCNPSDSDTPITIN